MSSKRKNKPKLKITGATKIDGHGQRGKNAKHRKEIDAMKADMDNFNKSNY